MTNIPYRFMHLNTWSPVAAAAGEVREDVGGKVFLEEVCHEE